MILCKCPACSKAYKVRDELAGKSAKCGCGNRFIIPAASEASPPAAPISQEPSVPAVSETSISVPDIPQAPEPVRAEEPAASAPEPQPQPIEQAPVAAPPAAEPAPIRQPVATPIQPPRRVGLEPVAARAPAPAAIANDEGNGGVGRITFILALVFVTVIAVILATMARHSGMGLRAVAMAWLVISAIAMFIVTQARLINIGYNEWFALLLPVMIGCGALLPEGFKAPPRSNAPKPKNAGALMAGAIVITIAFAAACGGFAYYLLYIA